MVVILILLLLVAQLYNNKTNIVIVIRVLQPCQFERSSNAKFTLNMTCIMGIRDIRTNSIWGGTYVDFDLFEKVKHRRYASTTAENRIYD
jgi:hypothetical protein